MPYDTPGVAAGVGVDAVLDRLGPRGGLADRFAVCPFEATVLLFAVVIVRYGWLASSRRRN